MPGSPLFILTLECPRERAEEISDWFADHWAASPVALERPGSAITWLEAYFESELEAELAGAAADQAFGLPRALRPCEDRDWAESWKEHFHARHIGRRLWLCPPWVEDPPPFDEALRIVVNPGLSFGTGDHFTTRFCLEALEGLLDEAPVSHALDLGAGSGVLSIAAAALGCPHIHAVDHDPLAIEAAASNLALNGLDAQRVQLEHRDLLAAPLRDPAPLVLANLFDQMLIEIASWLVPLSTGSLVLSGIRAFQADAVAEVCSAFGARETARDSDAEWCGMVFRCG